MNYVYGFGFETPRQRALNLAHGYDDEDSAALIIEAETIEAAHDWGRVVAEAFMRWLYDDPGVSWAAGQYADWIEPHPGPAMTPDRAHDIPTVRWGQMPALARVSVHERPQPL